MKRWIQGAAVVAAILLASAIGAANALGTTGEITEATVSPDWTQGSFAGTIDWTACAHPIPPPPKSPPSIPEEPVSYGMASYEYVACVWTGYATIGPAASPDTCASPDRQLGSLGADIQLVWEGEPKTKAGPDSFASSEFPLDGKEGKVLCLAAAEKTSDGTTIPCVPPGNPPPGWHCPYVWTTYFATLDSHAFASADLSGLRVSGDEGSSPTPCFCPAPRPHRRHRAKHRHRRIFLSQHRKVPVS